MTEQTPPIAYFGTGSDAGDHSFLSNFYVEGDGLTLEHWYQAAKTTDAAMVAKILSADTPGEAKKLGRKAKLRHNWEDMKLAVMLTLLRKKFSDPILSHWLVATGDAQLIEGNWWGDTYWGVCKGYGQNHLGRLLMQVREEQAEMQRIRNQRLTTLLDAELNKE